MRIFSALLVFVLFFNSCDNGDDEVMLPAPVLEVEVNDSTYTLTEFNNDLVSFEATPGGQGRSLNISCPLDTGTLILKIINWEWQLPPTDGVLIKTYDAGPDQTGANTDCPTQVMNNCDQAIGEFHTFLDTLVNNIQIPHVYSSEFLEDDVAGEIAILQNDTELRLVSGTFNFKAQSIFRSTDKKTFKGTFLNLPY